MAITALPSQTVHAIGSTQALTDSASVVKELVDNALDAQSNTITLEISANALDVIQVKDNGHGIAPIDRSLVCKRYCTSKIKDLDDLARIGGASLGFRGEALASAVEMSGGLTITTRIVGEATAVSLKVSRNGEVTNEDRVSHAVGTTVRITDFLKNIPVRRQTAIKESGKQLAKIKRTLQAYALARPSVRLSLKVLKAKSDKGNWIYAPKSDGSVSDAAVKVVGKKLSDQCQWIVWGSSTLGALAVATGGEATDTSEDPASTYQIEASIPRPDAVSCNRGILKQIIQLYKSYIRSSFGSMNDPKIIDPFLCMNLVCPPSSYDANVEPAKDDVLFTDSPRVMRLVESFFKSQYGELQPKNKHTTSDKRAIPGTRSFDLLLARKPPTDAIQPATPIAEHRESLAFPSLSHVENAPLKIAGPDEITVRPQPRVGKGTIDQLGGTRRQVGDAIPENTQSSPIRPSNGADQLWHQSVYPDEDDNEPIDVDRAIDGQDPEDEEKVRDISVSNPWTFAKLNAPIRPQQQSAKGATSGSSNEQLLTPAKQHGRLGADLSSPNFPSGSMMDLGLPTPTRSQNDTTYEASSPNAFPYPIKRWGKAYCDADLHSDPSPSKDQSSPALLNSWVQRPSLQSRAAGQEVSHLDKDADSSRTHRDFIPASELPQGTPLNAIPDISQAPRRKSVPRKQPQPQSSNSHNRPFKPPAVHDHTRVWFDHLDNRSTNTLKPTKPSKACNKTLTTRPLYHTTADNIDNDRIIDEAIPSLPQQQHQHPGLALTMDYEARKAAATVQRRAFLREQAKGQRTPHLVLPPGESSQGTQVKISPSQQSSQQPSSSPHQNRYNAAVAALQTPLPGTQSNPALEMSADVAASENTEEDMELPQSNIDPKDPCAHLIRTQNTNQISNDNEKSAPFAGRVRRTKTTFLPLETLSTLNNDGEGGLRNLIQNINTSHLLSRLAQEIRDMGGLDAYINGEIEPAAGLEDLSDREVDVWEVRVWEMIARMYPLYEGEGMGRRIDVGNALRQRGATA
ncbi:MAG: hypothetical protein Q9166_002583 [cf. Caloplaca sp. 2 TL-2023]